MTKVAIIPARAGSKRLPHKNRMTINNKSLVEITIICAIESGVFDDIIVSTDDDYFFKLNKTYNGIKFLDRPASLATSEASSTDVILHALQAFGHDDDSYSCLLQPTSPMRIPDDITASFGDNVVSFFYDRDHVMNNNHNLLEHLARLQITIKQIENDPRKNHLYLNGMIYWTKTQILRSQGGFFSGNTRLFEIPFERSYDIDYRADFNQVKKRLEQNRV